MRKLMMATAVLLVLGASGLEAQSATATGNVSITIDKVAYINVPNPDVSFNTPTNTDFATGRIAANNSVGIDYGANAPHELQVQLDGLGGKNVADLEWSLDGSSFNPMNTSAVTMVTQGSPGLNSETVDFEMKLDWANDTPGDYSGTITYTVVAN